MKTLFYRVLFAVSLLNGAWLAPDAAAQALPLEIRQDQTRYNLQSTNGVPTSSTRGTPPGSDGRGPTPAQQQAAGLTTIAATTNQFQGLITFGSLARPQTSARLNTNLSYAANAENLNLPRGEGDQLYVMVRARIGAPFLSRRISFLFGSVIPVPSVDEYGKALSSANTSVVPPRPATRPEDYWLAEPYTTTGHTNYYWSPHAQSVFAVNPGPLQVIWRKAAPSTPVGAPDNVGAVQISGSTYTILTNQYVVSGSAVKPPRQMYWTEGAFRETGKPIAVPTARVGDLAIIYNNNFTGRVAEEYKTPGQIPITDPNDPQRQPLEETRTLWYDRQLGQILAYNLEGRVFVELLGDQNPDGRTRQHLGIEIVDVVRQPDAAPVTIDLGELLTAYPNNNPDDADLFPEPLGLSGQTFTFRHNINGTDRVEFFATRETRNLNDLQVHWMEEGLQGLKWPFRFVRYTLIWPVDVAKYSHYVRPLVATEEEARATAVPLPNENAPIIAYQDPLDQPRAKLTEKFEYYTFLTPAWPAHRGLVRLNARENVRFERIFSWLDDNLKNSTFAGSLATNLSTWNAATSRHVWPAGTPAPRVVNVTVNVGDRLTAPSGEPGPSPGTNYLAGYLRQALGNSFNPDAYADPFAVGFEAANRGAIIPVNAIPGTNRLEVWWFRQNQVDLSKGFKNSYWPAVIGRYTLRWPTTASEIVLASNKGSGPLTSLQANGQIYFQNDATLPGYNPNEEHALMQGGQAFALRDDLNITTTNAPVPYSSNPYVLLSYTESDGRPAMRVFRVLREKPQDGVVFDYEVKAGTILQAPMPLPLLEKAFAPKLAGQPPVALNAEIGFWTVADSSAASADGVTTWTFTSTERHFFRAYRALALQEDASPTPAPTWFYPTSVGARALTGLASDRRPYRLAAYSGAAATVPERWRYAINDGAPLAINAAVSLFDPAAGTSWAAKITAHDTTASYVEVQFSGATPEPAKNATALVLPLGGGVNGQYDDQRMAYEPLPERITDAQLQSFYASFTLQDRKGNKWVYRGPHNPADTSSLVMKFYYKTLPGFFFPTLPLSGQPPVGTVTPYLRPSTAGRYEGDPIYGNRNNAQEGDDNPLGITYRPVWPANVPVLQMAETLTTPKRGLPAARGQTSLEIVYQQSQIAGGQAKRTVVLHDPTREKQFELGAPDDTGVLNKIPGSVKTQEFRGKTYFPNLPPHLADRFFLDPDRGANGALVFKGQFVDAALGDKYVFLNVLGTQDEDALKALCLNDDNDYAQWTAAIAGLSTKLELFVEDKGKPGTYIPSSPVSFGRTNLVEVTNDDQAVDSYALTAMGPGVGYVTLIAGNGRAFTPEGDPVSVLVMKVVDTLYRGEVNVVESSNPLNEKLTLQQVVDLAGKIEDFRFEWKIASPVDGLPPKVYENTPRTLLGNGTWSHLRYPLATDAAATIHQVPASRLSSDVGTSVSVVSGIPFGTVTVVDNKFHFSSPQGHTLTPGNAVVMRSGAGAEEFGTVHPLTTGNDIVVEVDSDQNTSLAPAEVLQLYERAVANRPQSIVFRSFIEEAGKIYSQFWLSLDLATSLGAKVYLDGQLAVTANTGANDSLPTSAPGGLFPLGQVYRVGPAALAGGAQNPDGSRIHYVAVELFAPSLPDTALAYNLRLEAYESRDVTSQQWLPLDADRYQDGVRAVLGGTADVRSLSDNYLIMRYQARNSAHASWKDNGTGGNAAWSQWTTPQLAEGWIKRVLKGINPFNQRVTDLFNNSVNTTVSIVAQAGPRWEGDVALNLETINDAGLIEIYETVLGRGKMLSIGAGINFGPANDALLLAAGYINDLYMILGNEAWSDASNPTIGIGTKDHTYGDIATALYSFKGQLPSLLEEELALLRGRDDFLLPGVELRPVYNRLVWNYTRGIDAGEVVYALNYNILDQNTDGVVDAEDARRLFPQGHGDAYGHYLTALKGYYSLLLDANFDWVPRAEAVTVLGKPVSVDYQDERKFAAAAGAVARTGKQIFDLTWRKDYQSGQGQGWDSFSETRANPNRSPRTVTTRYWGMDHWASRTGQGAYLNWVVGNAILPDQDPDPTHTGSIQQVDRTTVPELKELPAVVESLQTALDNAEGGLTPLGLPAASLAFDLNPVTVAGEKNTTHFEQVYERAEVALRNALAGFDDAKDVTRLLRSEQDSLADYKTAVDKQELAYTNTLVELYGTPYSDDIGPGKTYRTGFTGPDSIHYMYVDTKELTFGGLLAPEKDTEWIIDTQTFTTDWLDKNGISDFNFIKRARDLPVDGVGQTDDYLANTNLFIKYTLSSHGFFKKPEEWTGRRATPGRIQQAISDIIKARNAAYASFYWADAAKFDLDWAILSLEQKKNSHSEIRGFQSSLVTADQVLATAKLANEIVKAFTEGFSEDVKNAGEAIENAIPDSFIAGLAAGGDLTAPARAAIKYLAENAASVFKWGSIIGSSATLSLDYATETAKRFVEFNDIAPEEWNQQLREATSEVRDKVYGVNNFLMTINQRLQELDDAQRRYQSLLAEGQRIQEEREVFRQRAAAVIQGYRTRDAAFRIFRSEKLERYKTLFDLAAQYSFMAAQAFDYETGLLHTDQGKDFINRIIRSRALGVMQNGEPQFAGSNTGDPGLSSAMAEMRADWLVLKGRLGFNNPDAYGTTVSLRTENFRILPSTNSDVSWRDVLNQARRANILDDADVRRYCMSVDPGNGLPVPGIVLEFSTVIADGLNLFGKALAAEDHAYSPSSFATKLFAAGVALEGYVGMADPAANSSAVAQAAATSPSDPDLAFLDPVALSATPYVYLVPVGVDSMRSPPLGDAGVVRSWSVQDIAIPLPFNIGGSDFSTAPQWNSNESLSEEPFAIRKHQAFRPVSSASIFASDLYTPSGGLQRSQFTNNRLIGRSVWNSKWKLVIPGKTLLNNPDEGLERFIQTVKDVKLHFVTYSYSGN